jgi:hypothetical protein
MRVLSFSIEAAKKSRKRQAARSPASAIIAGTTSELWSVDVATAVAVPTAAGRRASPMTFFLRHRQQTFQETLRVERWFALAFDQRLDCPRLEDNGRDFAGAARHRPIPERKIR